VTSRNLRCIGTSKPYTPRLSTNRLNKVIPVANWNGIQLNNGTGTITNTCAVERGIGEIVEVVVPRIEALSRYRIILRSRRKRPICSESKGKLCTYSIDTG